MTSNPEYAGITPKKLSPQAVDDLLKTKQPFVLDVRPASFARCKLFIKNSIHIPLLHLSENLNKIPKDREIIIIDWAAKQSPLTAKFLMKKGYKVLGILRGGIEVWDSEGRIVEEREVDEKKFELKGDDFK